MKSLLILTSVLSVCLWDYNVFAYSLPGPRVYVVTPSPRPLQIDGRRSEPFYYHNWIRRMDTNVSTRNSSASTTTAVPKVKTPDLIFAEFESDSNDGMKKSLRKLLEKEKIAPQTTTTTTFRPIYIPDDDYDKDTDSSNYGLSSFNMKQEKNGVKTSNSPTDSSSMYKNWYNNIPSPVFLPSTTQSTTTKTITTTTPPENHKVENIWHIIDSERNNQYASNSEELPIESNRDSSTVQQLPVENNITIEHIYTADEIDENFALPGFGSNPGNGAENESRAIRYEPNIRFPYVNLKPFQLKSSKQPLNNIMDSKNNNNLMTSLDNFHDLKSPVRGEVQDATRNVIDRYNPAQPYLPPSGYGSKVSKQNSNPTPSKATALLVPPPPPPVPNQSSNDFPALTNPYESFPPYPPSFDSAPQAPSRPLPSKPPISLYSPPTDDTLNDSGTIDSDDGPPMDVAIRYKPPAPPVQHFIPTSSPISKPFPGYSYDKPPKPEEVPMINDKPDFHGYHYSKPESAPPLKDDMPPTYGPHIAPPTYGHDSTYPELIFDKHPGVIDDLKGSDDTNGMVPPPMDMSPADHGPSIDDHGFPSDFPGGLEYPPDFDDHDFYHHHHHHPTTTTTTEMPRVNRYSYYYLGKKLYYLPLYFSVYFIVYVGALIIKAVLRHKIVYPNSWRPNTTTASFFSKRSVDAYLSNDNLHELTGRVTHAIATAAEKYLNNKLKNQ